jgi:hypothetical protein
VRWIEKNCPDGHALMLESQMPRVAPNLTVGNIISPPRAYFTFVELTSRSAGPAGAA